MPVLLQLIFSQLAYRVIESVSKKVIPIGSVTFVYRDNASDGFIEIGFLHSRLSSSIVTEETEGKTPPALYAIDKKEGRVKAKAFSKCGRGAKL
jgi:hypothetical protein